MFHCENVRLGCIYISSKRMCLVSIVAIVSKVRLGCRDWLLGYVGRGRNCSLYMCLCICVCICASTTLTWKLAKGCGSLEKQIKSYTHTHTHTNNKATGKHVNCVKENEQKFTQQQKSLNWSSRSGKTQKRTTKTW